MVLPLTARSVTRATEASGLDPVRRTSTIRGAAATTGDLRLGPIGLERIGEMPESAIVGDPLVIDQSRDRSLYGGGGEVDAFDDGVGNRTRHLLAASGGPAHEVTGHGVGVDRTERNGLGHAVEGGAMHVDKLLHHVMATAGDDEQHLRVAVGKPFEGVRQFGAKVDDGVELVEDEHPWSVAFGEESVDVFEDRCRVLGPEGGCEGGSGLAVVAELDGRGDPEPSPKIAGSGYAAPQPAPVGLSEASRQRGSKVAQVRAAQDVDMHDGGAGSNDGSFGSQQQGGLAVAAGETSDTLRPSLIPLTSAWRSTVRPVKFAPVTGEP